MRTEKLLSRLGLSAVSFAVACGGGGSSNTNDAGQSEAGLESGTSDASGPDGFADASVEAGADAAADSTTSDSGLESSTQPEAAAEAEASSDMNSGDDDDASDVVTYTTAPAVYTMSNAAAGNAIYGFLRASDGTLTPMAAPFSTGGAGTGASLGEQGAIAFDDANHWLYAVNAGDGTFSIFPVQPNGALGSPVRVPGAANLVGPKSIAVFGNTVYVLFEGNATTPSMIAGWKITARGGAPVATAIAGSALALSSSSQSVDPAEAAFSPDGTWLMVTEKQSGTGGSVAGQGSIDVFAIDGTGLATKGGFYPFASLGLDGGAQSTPYGFAFYGRVLVVSEAGSGTVGSFTYAGGVIAPANVASQFLPTDPAPCWVAIGSNWPYVANAQGPDISGFTVGANGSLTPIGTGAGSIVATTGTATEAGTIFGPTDEIVSLDGRFLYVLNAGVPSIGIFAINPTGTLTRVSPADYAPGASLPAGAVGIVAR